MQARRQNGFQAGLFFCLFFLAMLAPLLSPLQQLKNGAPVMYINAFDEYHYLSWDVAQGGFRLLRASQGLVRAGHLMGLSGGMLNFLFDLAFPLATVGLVAGGLHRLGLARCSSLAYALCGLGVMSLFVLSFPLWKEIAALLTRQEWLRFATLPMARFPPHWRTPEPQFSWLVLAFLFFLLAGRRKHWWLAGAAVPLLYYFTAYPLLYVCLALLAMDLLKGKTRHAGPLALLLAVPVAWGLAALYRTWFMPAAMTAALTVSHGPLLPISGVLAAGLLKRAWPRLGEARWPLAALAVSPFVAANHQLFSGILTQPNNFEDAWGVVVCAILLMVNLHWGWSWKRAVALAVVIAAVLVPSGLRYHRKNRKALPPRLVMNDILTDLQTGRAAPLIHDHERSSYFALALPRTAAPPFSVSALPVWPLKENNLLRYACARRFAKASSGAAAFAPSLRWLDQLVIYEAGDYFLHHLFRRNTHPRLHTIPENPAHCPKVRYKLYVLPK